MRGHLKLINKAGKNKLMTPFNTEVYLNGKKLPTVTNLAFSMEAGNIARAYLEILVETLEIDGKVVVKRKKKK